jgi:hypothetical protein
MIRMAIQCVDVLAVSLDLQVEAIGYVALNRVDGCLRHRWFNTLEAGKTVHNWN